MRYRCALCARGSLTACADADGPWPARIKLMTQVLQRDRVGDEGEGMGEWVGERWIDGEGNDTRVVISSETEEDTR